MNPIEQEISLIVRKIKSKKVELKKWETYNKIPNVILRDEIKALQGFKNKLAKIERQLKG